MAYRVYTQNGYIEFKELADAEVFHAEHGISPIEEFEIQTVWDKNSYIQEINKAHSNWYESIYKKKPEFDYENQGEIVMYLYHEDETLRNQAKYLTDLWFASVDVLCEHIENVTENTANIDAFIEQLNTLC